MTRATVAMTIRKIPAETHRALKLRAIKNGTSVEAEARAILNIALGSQSELNVGDELAKIGREFAEELAEIDFDSLRDKTPARFANFE